MVSLAFPCGERKKVKKFLLKEEKTKKETVGQNASKGDDLILSNSL